MPHALSDIRHAPLGPRPCATRHASCATRHTHSARRHASFGLRPRTTPHAPCYAPCATRRRRWLRLRDAGRRGERQCCRFPLSSLLKAFTTARGPMCATGNSCAPPGRKKNSKKRIKRAITDEAHLRRLCLHRGVIVLLCAEGCAMRAVCAVCAIPCVPHRGCRTPELGGP